MESFTYQYPVLNYFGEGAMERALEEQMPAMGSKVMLAYGGGSVKRTGIYDRVAALLQQGGKTIVDFGGIMSNPTYAKVQEGAALARKDGVDFILAVGGGSVFDCCKIVSAQAKLDTDIDEYEHKLGKTPTEFIPLGCIVTLSGAGAEQNAGGVITNEETHVKGPFFGALPQWAALDPAFTLTVPEKQFVSGAFDSLSHCMETYFGTPRTPNVSDDINFAVQRNIIRNMRAHRQDPGNLDVRGELVYDSAMGENGVLKIDRVTDFQCHMIQHQYGAYTHSNYGLGLGIIHPPLYRHLAPSAPGSSPAGPPGCGMSIPRGRMIWPWPTRASMPWRRSSPRWACPPASRNSARTPSTRCCGLWPTAPCSQPAAAGNSPPTRFSTFWWNAAKGMIPAT